MYVLEVMKVFFDADNRGKIMRTAAIILAGSVSPHALEPLGLYNGTAGQCITNAIHHHPRMPGFF